MSKTALGGDRPIIVVEGVRKSFGAVTALDGIDFEVPRGTVFGVLGPNGAGKTTAVRILTTLLPPDAGYVEVAGYDVVRDSRAVRFAIGLAGQSVAVDAHLSGQENLILVARLRQLGRRQSRAAADELLERFDLTKAAKRTTRTYSGGMRRRLDLAASLVGHPPVLFLDEPTTGLDPRSRLELWEVIEGLVAEGTTLLLTTQYLEEADRLAKSIAVVDAGRVIAQGTPAELKAAVGGEMIELSVSEEADVERARRVLSGLGVGEAGYDTSSRTITVAAPRGVATLMDAIRGLDEAGIEPEDLSLRSPALDDVFMALTGRPAETTDPECGESGESEEAGRVAALAPETPAPAMAARPVAEQAVAPQAGDHEVAAGRDEGRRRDERGGRGARFIGRARGILSDTGVVMWRNLLRYIRLPNLLVFTTVQPVMFVLMFNFVFGGVIKLVVHGPYIDYLMPGIFIQAVIFNSTQTGIGMAEDLSGGMVDRFRSLPMARVAVLTGRTMADTVRNVFVVLLMTVVGIAVGFRITHGILPVVEVVLIAIVFGNAFSWISAVIGLVTKDVEAAQAAGFVWVLPLTFASSAFVPIPTMPGWLQAFSKVDPVSVVVGAMRALLMGGPTAVPLYESAAWAVGILVVCVPATLWLYRRLT